MPLPSGSRLIQAHREGEAKGVIEEVEEEEGEEVEEEEEEEEEIERRWSACPGY
jgi:t-SNARE complex subunit (syntaxin)